MPGAKKKLLFLAMFEEIIGQKPGKSSSNGRARHRDRSGVVKLVGREPLMFANKSREQRDKISSILAIVPIFSPKNFEKRNFGLTLSTF